MIGWIIFLIFIELYSIGMCILQKKMKNPKYLVCLIPFVSFFYLDKLLKGYNVLGIRVDSLGKTSIILTIISLCASGYAQWGIANLPTSSSGPLQQVMMVPIGFSILVLWLNLAKSTSDLLFKFKCHFRGDLFVCLLMISVPLLIAMIKDNTLKNKEKV